MEGGETTAQTIDSDLSCFLAAIKQSGKLTVATAAVAFPTRRPGPYHHWSERIGQPLVTKEQGRGTQLTALGERLLWAREASMRGSP